MVAFELNVENGITFFITSELDEIAEAQQWPFLDFGFVRSWEMMQRAGEILSYYEQIEART